MSTRCMAALAAALMLCVAGCGDDDAPAADAPVVMIDAPPAIDAEPPRPLCEQFCECMPTNCPGVFPDTATCMSTCEALSPGVQDCRNYHCGLAAGAGAALHCPHTQGMGMCQQFDAGVP